MESVVQFLGKRSNEQIRRGLYGCLSGETPISDLEQHVRKACTKPEGHSPEIVRVLPSERSRMPFYRLPVQSHYAETVIQPYTFSNHTLVPHYTSVEGDQY